MAAHVSRTAASKLSAVLLGPTRLAYRHVDATNGDELVRLRNHELEIFARPRVCSRLRADHVFFHLGRLTR